MSRTILVGDIHNCADELDRLLDSLAFTESDRLICVGDILVRGPNPLRTLNILYQTRALCVRGNHEDKLIRWHAGLTHEIGPNQHKTALKLRLKDWRYLIEMPFHIDLPEHGIRVVHAGVLPTITFEKQKPQMLMNIRTLDRKTGRGLRRHGPNLWGLHYKGPPHIVFGHNAQREPQIHKYATGIDTGAVYGNRLTAMVLHSNERVPPLKNRKDVLRSVPARKEYFEYSTSKRF